MSELMIDCAVLDHRQQFKPLMSSIRDFIPLQKLGEGSYSTVYKVRRLDDQRVYALKKVRMRNLTQKQKENALNQIRILASLQCPTIIAYKEAFFEEKVSLLCIVMEYACGGDVHMQISQLKRSKAMMPEPNIWKMVADVLEALAHLHSKGILHRDLKSANIFMDLKQIDNSQDSSLHSGCRYKLGDLNVSKVNYGGHAYTQTGTPYYASPEVWRDEPYDSKSDIYSFGCIIYEMACLHPPFEGKNMDQLFKRVQSKEAAPIPPQYSYELADLIGLCLRKNPRHRPDASELLQHPVIKRFISRSKQHQSVSMHKNIPGNDINQSPQALLRTIKLPADLKSLHKNLPCSNYDNKRRKQDQPSQRGIERISSTPSLNQILDNYNLHQNRHHNDKPCEETVNKGLKQEMVTVNPCSNQAKAAKCGSQMVNKPRKVVSPHLNLIQNHSHVQKNSQNHLCRQNDSQQQNHSHVQNRSDLHSGSNDKNNSHVQNDSHNDSHAHNYISVHYELQKDSHPTPSKAYAQSRVNRSEVYLSPRPTNIQNLQKSPQEYANRKNESAHIRMPADKKQFYSDRKAGEESYRYIHSAQRASNLSDRYEKLIRLQLNKKQASLPRTEKRIINSLNSKGRLNVHQDISGYMMRDATERKAVDEFKRKLVKKSRILSGNGLLKQRYCS